MKLSRPHLQLRLGHAHGGYCALQNKSSAVVLPLTTAAPNKLDLGVIPAGTYRFSVTGHGDVVSQDWPTQPDGSLYPIARGVYSFATQDASYPSLFGGDGGNHFAGGGANYDFTGSGFGFAGPLTTDTSNQSAIRSGAVVATFSPNPARSDWFFIGSGTSVSVSGSSSHLYLAVNDSVSADNHGSYVVSYANKVVLLPLITGAANKLDLGVLAAGSYRFTVRGHGDLVSQDWQTKPDGSLYPSAEGPYAFATPDSPYPAILGGDGDNDFLGGGANYDFTGSGFGFAGALTTDTSVPAVIRTGAVVGTFSPSPTRSDWFLIGSKASVAVLGTNAHLYLAVNDSVSSDNHGSYLVMYQPIAVNDVVTNFSSGKNPFASGAFTYGSGTSPSTFKPMPSDIPNCNGPSTDCRWNGLSLPQHSWIAWNGTGASIAISSIIQPSTVVRMDPQSAGSIVRFTAPRSASYSVTGSYSGLDLGQLPVTGTVYVNGSSAFATTIATFGQTAPFSLAKVYLSKGQNIDFIVKKVSGISQLSTGLSATIAQE